MNKIRNELNKRISVGDYNEDYYNISQGE